MPKNKSLLAWSLLILLALIWGSSFILIKRGLEVFPPGAVGAIRIFSASLFLLPWALAKAGRLRPKTWALLATVGFCGSFIPAFLFAYAQSRLASSVAGVLNALTPLMTMLVGVFAFGQKTNRKVALGLALGLVGSAVLILAGTGGQLTQINHYAFLVILACLFYATNLNLIKAHLADIPATTITAVSLMVVCPLAGGYLIFFTDFIHLMQHQPKAYPALGYLVVLGVVGTAMALVLFNRLVKITSPIFTSSVTYIIPIVALSWGLVDGEVLFLGHFAGLGCILLGVYLANRP